MRSESVTKGSCRFVEEVLAELATPVFGPDITESDATPRSANGFMGDAAHTGRSENRGPSASPTPAWTYQTGARVFASPVVGNDGTVYVGSLDGQFVALNADGSLKWRYSAGQKIYPSALVAGSSIIFGTHQRELVSLSLQGQPRWKLPLQDVVDASATLGPDGRVYVVANGAYAVDLLGRLHWHKPTADHVRSAPVIHPARLVIIGTTEGSLIALRPDGSLAWSVQLGGAIEGAASVDDEGHIYTGTGRGEIVQVDQTGTVRWRFKTGDEVRATPAIARDGTIIVGSYDGNVYAISPVGRASLEGRHRRPSTCLSPNRCGWSHLRGLPRQLPLLHRPQRFCALAIQRRPGRRLDSRDRIRRHTVFRIR